ncbi:hypothetical protein Tco_1397091 [Tanacetum coccineum]
MVSMSSLMRQVKYGGKAAAQAKEEVVITDLHILTKVDELKKKQQLAKETNKKVVDSRKHKKSASLFEVNAESYYKNIDSKGFLFLRWLRGIHLTKASPSLKCNENYLMVGQTRGMDATRDGEEEDRDISLKDLSKKLEEFAKARDWEKYHTPRNLLLAMVLHPSSATLL